MNNDVTTAPLPSPSPSPSPIVYHLFTIFSRPIHNPFTDNPPTHLPICRPRNLATLTSINDPPSRTPSLLDPDHPQVTKTTTQVNLTRISECVSPECSNVTLTLFVHAEQLAKQRNWQETTINGSVRTCCE